MPFLISSFSKKVYFFFHFTVSLCSLPPPISLQGRFGHAQVKMVSLRVPTCLLEISDLKNLSCNGKGQIFPPIPHLPTQPPWSKEQVNSFKRWSCDLTYLPMHQEHGGEGTCLIAKESYFLIFSKLGIYLNSKRQIFITHFFTCTLFQSKWYIPEYKTNCTVLQFLI